MDKKSTQKNQPIKLRSIILIFMTVLILLSSHLYGIFSYISERDLLLEGMDAKLLSTAYMANEILSPDYHNKITDENSVTAEEYLNIVDRWNSVCTRLHLENIWSLMKIDDKLVFTSGTSTDRDDSNQGHVGFLEEYSSPEALDELFSSMEVQYHDIDNDWGRLRLVLLPYKDASGRAYVVGASIKIETLNAFLYHLKTNIIKYTIIILLMDILISIVLSRIITKPLSNLVSATESISLGHLDGKVDIKGPNEIRLLGRSIDKMRLSILENITNLNLSREIIKKKEKNLRKKERRLELALFGANDGIWDWDLINDRLYFDERYYTMAGYAPSEYPAAFDEWKTRVHPDDIGGISDQADDYYSGDCGDFNQTFRFRKKDGSYMWIRSKAKNIRNEEGQPIRLIGTHSDFTEIKIAQLQIEEDLREKQIMIKEIHHRVKNNLNIINSLLSMQADEIENKQDALLAFRQTQNRIFSMASIHEMLHENEILSRIDMEEYIRDITSHFLMANDTGSRVSASLKIENVLLGLNQAIPCGLIINELISNVLRTSFAGEKSGSLKISLYKNENDNNILTISDSGTKRPPDFFLEKDCSLELKIASALAEQLCGSLSYERAEESTFSLIFPAG